MISNFIKNLIKLWGYIKLYTYNKYHDIEKQLDRLGICIWSSFRMMIQVKVIGPIRALLSKLPLGISINKNNCTWYGINFRSSLFGVKQFSQFLSEAIPICLTSNCISNHIWEIAKTYGFLNPKKKASPRGCFWTQIYKISNLKVDFFPNKKVTSQNSKIVHLIFKCAKFQKNRRTS